MSDKPIGWQYRFRHVEWTQWTNVPLEIEEFKRIQETSLKRGTVELRPIYDRPQCFVGLVKALEEIETITVSDADIIERMVLIRSKVLDALAAAKART